MFRRKLANSMIAELVAGILTKNGRFLVEKRRLDDEVDPGLVEVPGGHVDTGESLEAALKRELREELGIQVNRMSFVVNGLATASTGEKGRIHYFHVTSWHGRIRAREAERVYWESRIRSLSISSDRRAVEKVLKSKLTTSHRRA